MRKQEPRSSSSCAACKFLKRRCKPTCTFSPYFPSNDPKRFVNVHKVFGAGSVSKILALVPEDQREDTVTSLVYEAEARLKDPIYGCTGAIAFLQNKIIELQCDLAVAKARLAHYTANFVAGSEDYCTRIQNLIDFPDWGESTEVSGDTQLYDFHQIPPHM